MRSYCLLPFSIMENEQCGRSKPLPYEQREEPTIQKTAIQGTIFHYLSLLSGPSRTPVPTRHDYSLFISFKRTVEDAGPYNVNPQNSQAHFGEPLQREPQKFILRFGKPLQKSRAKIALLFVALKGVKHGNYVGNAF